MAAINDLLAFVPSHGWYAVYQRENGSRHLPLAGWAHTGSTPGSNFQTTFEVVGVIADPTLVAVNESDPTFRGYTTEAHPPTPIGERHSRDW